MSRQPTAPVPAALLRVDARAILDAHGCFATPASILIQFAEADQTSGSVFPSRILAVGRSVEVDAHEAARAPSLQTIRRPGAALIPGLVNAHTHLDLTHIGPQPHDPARGFVPWIDLVRTRRLVDPEAIAASVRRGVDLSLGAGVVAVGDIGGAVMGRASLAAYDALAATPMRGVSFVEFFALGTRERAGLDALAAALAEAERRDLLGLDRPLQLGIQPHSPYAVSPRAYLEAARMVNGRARMCTHLAETPEERMLIARAAGPLRTMLDGLGLWNDALDGSRSGGGGEGVFGHPVTPVQHVRDAALNRVPLFAHVNDASDEDIDLLARAGASVAYCPRAAAYFDAAAHFGPHRYRDMLARGVNVALGTDSLINLPGNAGRLPSESSEGRGMSVLEETRFLHRRDGTDPLTLLRMGTTNAALALGLPEDGFRFAPGNPLSGLVACPVGPCANEAVAMLDRLMTMDSAAELLCTSRFSVLTESGVG